MRGSHRKLLIFVVAAVVIGTLAYRSRDSIALKGFSWKDVFQAVRNADPWLLLASLAAIYVVYMIRALRWARFSRYIGQPHFWNMLRATLIGFSAIFLLGRAGEPIRPLMIARKDNLPVSATFGVYVMERMFDMASTAVLAAVSLLAFPQVLAGMSDPALAAKVRGAGILLVSALLAGISFLLYFRFHGAGAFERRMSRWRTDPAQPPWRHKIAGLFSGFAAGLQSIRTLGDLAAAIFYSAAHWVLVALIYVWVMHAFGGRLATIDFPGAVVVLAFTMVGSAVQLPAVGGGSQAACFIAFTAIFGVEKEPAAAAAVVMWLITFAGCSLAGIPLLLAEGWSMGELRQMARAEKAAEAAGTHLHLERMATGRGDIRK